MIPPVHQVVQPGGVLHHGLYPATVTALEGDPDNRQRVKVRFDWLATTEGDIAPEGWAVLITPYADAEQGFQMLPEIGSTVVVGFQAGPWTTLTSSVRCGTGRQQRRTRSPTPTTRA